MRLRPSIVLLSILIRTALTIPVPNGQLGNVEIECGEKTIEAVFLTEAEFEGRIFVIGHAHDPKCVSRDTGRRTTSIVIDKNECGVVTTRSTDPNGLFSTVKLMISFHNDFVTKVDRGYEISCFYMAGDKTVTYPITVNTPSLAGITEIAEMPRCRYEVIDPGTGEPAEVVTVGNKLLHRWICESTAPDLWCMKVHSCRVEDGSGTEFLILDERGCSVDRYLLDNLEYGPGDLQAQKEAHAFKFADKVVVNFQCSVRLDIKDGECPPNNDFLLSFHIPECEDPLRLEQARKAANRGRQGVASVAGGGAQPATVAQTVPRTTHRVQHILTTHAPQRQQTPAAHQPVFSRQTTRAPISSTTRPPTVVSNPASIPRSPPSAPRPSPGLSSTHHAPSNDAESTTAMGISTTTEEEEEEEIENILRNDTAFEETTERMTEETMETTENMEEPEEETTTRATGTTSDTLSRARPVFRNPQRPPSEVHLNQRATTPHPATTTRRATTTRNPVHPVFRGKRHAGYASELSFDNIHSSIEVDVRSQQIDVLDPIFDSDRATARAAELRRLRRNNTDCVSRSIFMAIASSSLALITLLIATVVVLLLRPPRKA